MEIPQEIKNISTKQSSNSTSGHTPKGNEKRISTKYIHTNVYVSITHNKQYMKRTLMPING